MKNILNKIYIHPLFIFILFIFILLGRFRIICYFMILIVIHELGHVLTGIYFKWKINKIIILPFGCLTKFDIDINTRLIEEFIVSISGVIFQYTFYLIISRFITYYYFSYINYFLIIFNLLPIIPLDGSKILSVLLNKKINFYTSLYVSSIISIIFIIIFNILLFNINKLIVIVSIFLFIETLNNYKSIKYVYNKFLIERYIKKYNFKRSIIINNVHKMRKEYRHIFLLNNKYTTERIFLSKMFDFNGKV